MIGANPIQTAGVGVEFYGCLVGYVSCYEWRAMANVTCKHAMKGHDNNARMSGSWEYVRSVVDP